MERTLSQLRSILIRFPVALFAGMIFLGAGLSLAAEQVPVNAQANSKQVPTPSSGQVPCTSSHTDAAGVPALPSTSAIVAIEPVAQGMRAFIDPKTGKLREPTEDELATISARGITTLKSTEIKVLTGPKGAVGVALDESYMVHSVARINPDGSISMECVTGKENAEKALSETPSHRLPAEKEVRHEK